MSVLMPEWKDRISVNDNAMELTLLWASTSPAMRADNRVHRFTYDSNTCHTFSRLHQ